MKMGLALGGGGAKGFTHIGALRVLEKEKIKVDNISGTSMGALVAALYSLDRDTDYVYSAIKRIVNSKAVLDLEEQFFKAENGINHVYKPLQKTAMMIRDLYVWNLRVLKRSFVDADPFEEMFFDIFNGQDFSQTCMPLSVVATNLVSGDVEYLESGMLHEAVLASISLPGIFPPLKQGSKFLVDGGVLEPVPIEALGQKQDFIFAISLEPKRKVFKLKSSLDVMLSSDEMRHNKIVSNALEQADFVFEPFVDDCAWAQFSRYEEMVARGEEEMAKIIPELKKAIRARKVFPFWGLSKKDKLKRIKPVEIVTVVDESLNSEEV